MRSSNLLWCLGAAACTLGLYLGDIGQVSGGGGLAICAACTCREAQAWGTKDVGATIRGYAIYDPGTGITTYVSSARELGATACDIDNITDTTTDTYLYQYFNTNPACDATTYVATHTIEFSHTDSGSRGTKTQKRQKCQSP